jgi:TonB family protein
MRNSFARFPRLIVFLWLAFLAAPAVCQTDLEQHLRDQYQGKTFVLRGFYAGNSLHYDSTGTLWDGLPGGDWTVDGAIHVEDIQVSRDHVTIHARRLHLGWMHDSGLTELHDLVGKDKQDQEKNERKDRAVEIVADLGPGQRTTETADAVVARIFLNSQDSLADLVPDYWKPCIRVAASNGGDKSYQSCRFPAEFLAIPGVAAHSDLTDRPENDLVSGSALKVGGGVKPPRAVFQLSPEFTDEARKAKFQGTVNLGLVVDAEGLPADIHIRDPLGCGLDAQAVHTAKTWKFNPAEKEGHPVAVQITVEVEFRLY